MIKKILLVMMTTLVIAIAAGWPDITRYAKIRQISMGGAEKVPATGRKVYPQHHDDGAPDGTGDFDSASRGGPAAG